jgi:hypothetical protein
LMAIPATAMPTSAIAIKISLSIIIFQI